MVQQVVHVKISEFKVGFGPALLKISGLGSCVALAIYDPDTKTGGLAHILLPGPAPKEPSDRNLCKYADQAIKQMLAAMNSKAKPPARLEAKITGGANMFAGSELFETDSKPKQTLGERNVLAVRRYLKQLSIPVVGEEVGGSTGRSVTFEPATGKMVIVTSHGHQTKL